MNHTSVKQFKIFVMRKKKPTKNKDHHVMHGGQGLYLSFENQHGVMDILGTLGLDTCRFEFHLWHLLVGKKFHFSELIVNSHCKEKKAHQIDMRIKLYKMRKSMCTKWAFKPISIYFLTTHLVSFAIQANSFEKNLNTQ